MKLNRKHAHPLILFVLVATVLAGCSNLPTSPVVDTSATRVEASAASEGLIGGLIDVVKSLLVKTLNLVGNLGGTLTNGRWEVAIPSGAVDGSATVTLGVTSSTSSTCQLEILPAEKNHFNVPVTLTINCSGVSLKDLQTFTILWLDPSTGRWVPVPGSKVDLNRKTVSAPLSHFSTYSAGPSEGKAGW